MGQGRGSILRDRDRVYSYGSFTPRKSFTPANGLLPNPYNIHNTSGAFLVHKHITESSLTLKKTPVGWRGSDMYYGLLTANNFDRLSDEWYISILRKALGKDV